MFLEFLKEIYVLETFTNVPPTNIFGGVHNIVTRKDILKDYLTRLYHRSILVYIPTTQSPFRDINKDNTLAILNLYY